MILTEIEKKLEVILFASSEPISFKRAAKLLELTVSDVKKIAENLKAYYEDESRGIALYFFSDYMQLGTNKQYSELLLQIFTTSRTKGLSGSVLEVLSIIAYKQPVTKSEIDYIRGVSSDYQIRSLLDRDLIEVKGELDKIGKPKIYGTTKLFLRNFNLESLSELPKPSQEDLRI